MPRPRQFRRSEVAAVLWAFGVISLAALGGCSSSIWQSAFRPSPLAGVADPASLRYPASHPVLVREAPWARVEAALKQLQEEEAQSDIHVSEWPDDQRLAATGRLLSALQLHDPPESVVLVGASSFTTTDNIRPADGSLAAQARRVGADYAIWSATYVGPGTRIVDRPVTIHRHGWARYYDRDDHVWRDGYFGDVDTAWVPIAVQADRFAYLAFFVRKRSEPATDGL